MKTKETPRQGFAERPFAVSLERTRLRRRHRLTRLAIVVCAFLVLIPFEDARGQSGNACVQPLAGLVGWWSGDGVGYDLQGTRHGTLRNGAAYAVGKVGQAFRLDGSDDYVDLGPWAPGVKWSIEAWVNPASTPAGRHSIVGGFNECRDWGLTMQDGQFGVAIRQPGGCSDSVKTGANTLPGVWYHLVGVCDGTNAQIYVNAELKNSGLVETNYGGTSSGTRIGGEVWSGGYNFPGLVDEVSVYDRALSASEIRSLFASGSAGKCKPTITGPVDFVKWTPNGHWYRAEFVGSTGISWQDARAAAESAGGYLATITSAEENAFVYSLVRYTPEIWSDASGSGLGPWVGGFQASGSPEPAGDWGWVTGESMNYTNWAAGEPNNSGGAENFLHFIGQGTLIGSSWNDAGGTVLVRGYIVEYDTVPRPLITSSTAITAVAGKPFAYQIKGLNHPTSFGASGLPAGLVMDTRTGEITGSPTVPGSFDVTLMATNSVSSGTADLRLTVQPQSFVAGMTLFSNSSSLTATDLSYEWNNVTVSNCTLTLGGIHHFRSLTVLSNGIVTHPLSTGSEQASLWLIAADGLVIDVTSRIDASGRGYLAGRTSVFATKGAAIGRSGGSYGGLGRVGISGSPNWTYGDFRNPREPGSGGGNDLGNASGGGLIRIMTESLVIHGSIAANGVSGFDYYNRAASSGGGIWLNAGTLAGSGLITANGGNGSGDGGSGGGGRVAVYYSDAKGFGLTNVTTFGGNGGMGPGAVGTVYLKPAKDVGTLRIDNQDAPTGVWTPLGANGDAAIDLTGEDLVIAGTNVVVKPEHQMPLKARNVIVTNGAVLTHQPTTGEQEYSLVLEASNILKIDETAKLDVSGLGYSAGITVGNTSQGGATYRSGGSYGGLGSAHGLPNPVYGDYRNPNELGSGGGPDLGGGNGGGLLRITAGSIILDGVIAANGKDGFDYYNRGAGSGGGIWVNAQNLTGTGVIRADGGNGSGDGGSGGGGRIALYHGTDVGFDFDRITAHGGSGGSGTGAVGTVYLKPHSGQAVLRIDNHGGISGSWTPLGVGSDQVFDIGPDKLVISGTNIIVKPEHQLPVKVHDLVIQNQAVLTSIPTTSEREFSLLLEVVGSLSIDTSSRIDVSSLGYSAGITVGNTSQGGATYRSGGSYGGLGSAHGLPNPVYGDYRNPNELGSGGGPDLGGGNGGGLLRITAGSIILDGVIAANGKDGFDYYNRGAGSGGGIWINAQNLTGTGVIRADGGNGTADGGSGGGGRVALYHGTNVGFDFDRITAHGGSGGSGTGAVGTVYLKPHSGQAVLRIDNHGGISGSWTPLGVGSDQVFDIGPDKLVISGTNIIVKPEHQLPVKVHDLVIQNQAVLTSIPTTSEREFSLLLEVVGSLSIDTSSRIDVSSLGYSAGITIGNTNKSGASYRSGGSYGGLGSAHGLPNPVYGDYRNPNELGSGGGPDLGGGNGGGLLRITAGSIILDGVIAANGKDGFDYYNRGAGSGGGIWINAQNLTGTGVIRADGGNGTADGGSGGGGRVALYYGTMSGFNAEKIMAHGGNGGAGAGAVGSVYLKSKTGEGVVRFDNHGSASGSWIPLGLSTGTIFNSGEDRVVVSGEKMVVKPEHQMPLMIKHLTLEKGAVLTHLPTTEQQENSLTLMVLGTLTVDGASRIDVSSLGYGAGTTVGNSSTGAATYRSGGSYGGLGGANGSPNSVYGDYRNPDQLGSGGGLDLGGGTGGGLARITADSLVLNGTIVANGRSGFDYYNRSAGSGGGIWINVNNLSGSGAIRANGGNAEADGGSGGGGRVALHYTVNKDFDFDSVHAHGGQGGSSSGAVGTVYLKSKSDRGLLRLDNHGVPTGSWTPLGLTGDDAFDASADLVVISGTNVVVKPAFQLPIKAHALSLMQGAKLTHRPTTAGEVFSLEVLVGERLEIDPSSRIDVSSLGYLAGRTTDNSNSGAASGRAGGSYGGLGGLGAGGNPNATYGEARNPDEPGAGSGLDLSNASGGGLARITAGSLFLEGVIKAHGASGFDYYNRAGGSGGGILISAGMMEGNGTITAQGGDATSDGGGGGGGRVALYAWGTNSLIRTNITALGGAGGRNPGESGTVFFATTPLFFWEDLDRSIAHGMQPLKWAGFGVNPAGISVDVAAFLNGVSTSLLEKQPMQGGLVWDTGSVPDGEYELRVIFRNATAQVVGEATRTLTVINRAQWHSGAITADETWSAGQIHIVEGNLKVDNNGQVTIPSGATVKFAPGGRVSVLKGGVLNVQGNADSRVTFTSLADDAVGGDTNLDGDKSRPLPGQWTGINVETEGKFNYNEFVDFRYLRSEHAGLIAKSETWLGTFLHQISGDIVVPNGVTLTIEPGAILKFNQDFGITVQAGGQLVARGAVALPITFTSGRDDSVGGDTNGDGDKTSPSAGDWRWILLDGGKAEFNHCQMRYGGGPGEGGWGPGGGPGKATIKTSGNAALEFTNSEMADSFYDGILSWGGPVRVVNSVFVGIDRALCAHPGSIVEVVNCTLDDNRVGLLIHGGEMRVTNTIVANSFTAGVLHDHGPDALALKSSVLWNPKATDGNYSGTADQTGRNGNLSIDPQFKDAARHNFRLNYLSPGVDAADGVAAPVTDMMGAPRYDDPRTANTGLATASGAFADMGAYEFVETAASDIDLIAVDVTGPTQVTAGDTATLSWKIRNAGSGSVTGAWYNAILLLPDNPNSNLEPLEAGESLSSAKLGPNQDASFTAQVRVPGGVEGSWRWAVKVNIRGEVFEGMNWTNNVGSAAAKVGLHVPELSVGSIPTLGQINQINEPQWFKVLPAVDQDILITLHNNGASDALELYLGRNYMPTRQDYDVRQESIGAVDAKALATGAGAQTCYVMVYGRLLPSGSASFTINAKVLDFSLTEISSTRRVGNTGPVTFQIRGGKLKEGLTYRLVGPNGQDIVATSVHVVNASEVYATFDLTGRSIGNYSLRVQDGGLTTSLNNAVDVFFGTPGNIQISLSAPKNVRPFREQSLVVEYHNVGDTDVLAPLMLVTSLNASLRFPDQSNDLGKSVWLLGISREGPAGTLPPGGRGSIELRFKSEDVDQCNFNVQLPPSPNHPTDWLGIKNSTRPQDVSVEAWDAIYSNFLTRMGSTMGQYQKVLTEDATYFSRLGHYLTDVQSLLAFELVQAGQSGAIRDRYRLGAFGRGQMDPTDLAAVTTANGDVRIRASQVFVRTFKQQTDGTYLSLPGDQGVISKVGNHLEIKESDGSRLVFLTDGKLDYMEDLNQNRVNWVYTNARLTGWTDSWGDTVQLSYNAQGRVDWFIDQVGRITTFVYDASGEHLIAVIGSDGTTNRFSYITAQGATREHAIGSINLADGTGLNFEYDAQGGLKRISRSSGEIVMNITTGFLQGTTLTDATGSSVTLLSDHLGQLNSLFDPFGNLTKLSYDEKHRLAGLTLPGGLYSSFQYDDRDNPITATDPLGQRVDVTYDPALNLPTSLRSPGGLETQFTYDGRGNPDSLTYPDNRAERVIVNAKGLITKAVNARGRETTLTYDGTGLLTRKEYADGSSVDFNYDARRNLTRAIQSSGIIYRTNAFAYDAADRPLKVTDPFNRTLEFNYDGVGRRIRMTTSDGFVVNYAYDVHGRLSQLTDASGKTNVVYRYDASSRLARKELGNKTFSTYEYDAANQLLHLVNRGSDNSILSRFDYTYDALGRRTRMVTLQGTNDYAYDAVGQLIMAALPGGRTIQYTYDAEGNRRLVTDNGAITSYLANSLNQYVTAGSAKYQYDADGNLVSKSDNGKTWTYAYDNEDRLIQVVTPESKWTYEYDGLGNRVAATENGQRREFLIDPAGLGDVVGEYDAGDRLEANYLHGVGLLKRITPDGGTCYYHFDALGSTTELTDASGSVLNRYSYLPFGEPWLTAEEVLNPFRFIGEWGVKSDENGLNYMRARYYESATGRFTQRDPLGVSSGINLYQYANNDAMNRIDPSGTVDFWLTVDFKLAARVINEMDLTADFLFALRPYYGMGNETAKIIQSIYFKQGAQAAIKEALTRVTATVFEKVAKDVGVQGALKSAAAATEAVAAAAEASAARWAFAKTVVGRGAQVLGGVLQAYTIYEGAKAWYQVLDFNELDYWTDGWLFGVPPSAQFGSKVVRSWDPNDIIGPAGYGEQSYVMVDFTMYYLIRYENKSNALAGAQMVMVTNQLASTLDFSTFELGNIGFGTNVITVPKGRQNYSTRVDVTHTLGLYVDVKAEFNFTNGLVLWTFTSIDPVTGGEPEDPLAGFLPPNTNAPAGEGWVRYSVRPRTHSTDGSRIQAMASIVFDTNARIDTPPITNAVDGLTPSSHVASLPATSPATFTVSWTGQDGLGAGVAGYSLFVSTNQGPFGLWLNNTTNTSAEFSGEGGNTYSFFSLAADGVGYWEQPPTVPDAVTLVELQTPGGIPTTMLPGPNMKVARMGHSITELPDGRVVVFGGHGEGFVSLNSIEIWRPDTDLFSLVSTPFTFDSGALVRLADGRYLMAGGAANLGVAPGYSTAQIFNPVDGTVASTGTSMTWRRTQSHGALLANGKVLIVGGWYDSNSTTFGELYDPTSRTFVVTGPLKTPRAAPIVLPAADGKAVIAGGMGVYGSPSFIETVEQYDPAQNAFTTLASTVFAGETGWALRTDLDRPIDDFQTADGHYAFLASRTANNITEVVLALFDPVTKQFTKRSMQPVFTEKVGVWPGVVASDGSAVYFLSGYNTNGGANLVFRVQLVELDTGERVASEELSVTSYYPGSSAAALLRDGRLFVTGGTSRVDSQYNFKPVSGTFMVSGLPGMVKEPAAPSLVWSVVGQRLRLAWPSSVKDYRLESAETLSDASSWQPVPDAVTVIEEQNTVTVDVVRHHRFFRLNKAQ